MLSWAYLQERKITREEDYTAAASLVRISTQKFRWQRIEYLDQSRARNQISYLKVGWIERIRWIDDDTSFPRRHIHERLRKWLSEHGDENLFLYGSHANSASLDTRPKRSNKRASLFCTEAAHQLVEHPMRRPIFLSHLRVSLKLLRSSEINSRSRIGFICGPRR